MIRMGLKREVTILLILLLLLWLCVTALYASQNAQKVNYLQGFHIVRDQEKLQKIVDETAAEGVIVYDPSTDTILAGKSIEKKYSLASLTKIITATIVYEKDKNQLNAIREMLKTSNNEEAEKLALAFGSDQKDQVAYMNAFTERFGEMNFRNVSGLDIMVSTSTDGRIPGGEARPMALVGFIKEYYFKYPELFDQTIVKKDNTNIIADELGFLGGGKTGYTDLSGGNLFVAIQKGLDREIFIIILNSTEKSRFVDVQHIATFLVQSSI